MPRATPMALDDRRAALVSATEPLLERFGRDITTRQIAEAAGVSEGTIFRAFETKNDLIDAVIEEVFDETRTREAVADVDRDLPLSERLIAAVTILQERTRRVFALFHALRLRPGWAKNEERPPSHDLLAERQRHDHEQLELVLIDLIGRDADRLRVSPREAVTALRGAVFALSHPLLGDEEMARPERIVDLVLHGTARHDPGKEPRC